MLSCTSIVGGIRTRVEHDHNATNKDHGRITLRKMEERRARYILMAILFWQMTYQLPLLAKKKATIGGYIFSKKMYTK